LTVALKTDFFEFFNLTEEARKKDSENQTVISFKPSGMDFRDLVTVRVFLGKGEKIVRMELLLARSFIDDPGKSIFASDIAKSFLSDAPPVADQGTIKDLVDVISSNTRPTDKLNPAEKSKEDSVRSPTGYLTYLGKAPDFTKQLLSSTVQLTNIRINGKDWLRIDVSIKP